MRSKTSSRRPRRRDKPVLSTRRECCRNSETNRARSSSNIKTSKTRRRTSFWAKSKRTLTSMPRKGRNNSKSNSRKLRNRLRRFRKLRREEPTSIKRMSRAVKLSRCNELQLPSGIEALHEGYPKTGVRAYLLACKDITNLYKSLRFNFSLLNNTHEFI